ncbi:MAG: nucleotidyltransferase domain-containing protein [Firmicutes bacterium]|nr:nucleotidyltransferase domain-containing protein [Bacillota bacterium]
MELDMETIKTKAVPILEKYGVTGAAVFGSYARGDQKKKSDINFLIEYLPGTLTLFSLVKMNGDLKKALKKKVQIVTLNSLSPHIKDNVLKDKRLIM